MLCENSDRIFNDYLDGDLAPAKVSQFELHLAECGACRRKFERLKLADDFLRRGVRQLMEEIPVPDSLLEGFEKRLAREKKGFLLRRISPLTRYAGIAAAFLILVAAAGLFRSGFGPLGRMDGRPVAYSSSPAAEMNGGSPDESQTSSGAAKEKQVAAGSKENLQNYDRLSDSGSRTSTGQPPVANNTGAGENLQKKGASDLLSAPEAGPDSGHVVGGPFPVAVKAPGGVSVKKEGAQDTAPNTAAAPGNAPPGLGAGGAGPEALRMMASAPVAASGGPALVNPALKQGSMDEAIKETGISPALPSYMPGGTSLTGVAWQKDAIYLHYRVGQFYVTIGKQRAPEGEPGTAGGSGCEAGAGCKSVDVSGARGCLSETGPQPGDSAATSRVDILWQKEGWAMNVEGNLPAAEILKIANSVVVKSE